MVVVRILSCDWLTVRILSCDWLTGGDNANFTKLGGESASSQDSTSLSEQYKYDKKHKEGMARPGTDRLSAVKQVPAILGCHWSRVGIRIRDWLIVTILSCGWLVYSHNTDL